MCGRGGSGVWDPGVKQTLAGRCRAAPGAQLGAQRRPGWKGGREVGGGLRGRAYVCMRLYSLCYTAEMNTAS